jgi:hypothetical protein
VSDDARAEYARLSALVRLRLDELERALDRHEFAKRWDEAEVLERVERGLEKLAEELR